MTHKIRSQLPIGVGAGYTLTGKELTKPAVSHTNKPLPMFAKHFKPAKGIMPATVFIGSYEAIQATKNSQEAGVFSKVCIRPGESPSHFSWGFLHSLPVLIYAEDDLPLETVHTLIIELARCGTGHITAMRLTGKVIAYYSPDAGRVAA